MADSTDDRNFNAFWHAMLSGEHPALRRGRKMLRLLSPTATDRCRLCCAGFDGFTAPAMRLMGRAPWRRNPHFCEQCEAVLAKERGGAEIEIAMLYADVRGSTQLAAGMRPAEFAALMQRFFQIAMKVFTKSDAMVDKMVGDEVIGIYLPGLTGSDYRQRVVAAGLELLRATGHNDPAGPWLSIGVGVHAGQDLRRLDRRRGRQLSVRCSRRPDELLCAARRRRQGRRDDHERGGVERCVERSISAEPCSLELKGYAEPVKAYVTRVTPV